MKKKIISLVLLLIATISITGCGTIKTSVDKTTEYINNSKKMSYIDALEAYISSCRTKINEAREYKFFNSDTVWFIPVSCFKQEYGGKSPFSDTWKYAYVGVSYSGNGYTYYTAALDGAGYGVNLLSQSDFSSSGAASILTSTELTNVSEFQSNYNITQYKTIAYNNLSNELKTALNSYGLENKNVVFVSGTECSYMG